MLNVESIQCGYDDQIVLRQLSFQLNESDIGCLLGPSGCGKTTALRTIAGFQPLSAGRIILNDQLLSTPQWSVTPEQRRIGMVFQDYALFPHLTVYDNISFGIRKQSAKKQQCTVNQLLELTRLQVVHKRYPHELSGGQQQRVALARALAPNPRLLLLDEPFSHLDSDLRRRLNLEVRDILKQYGISAILVTHDQEDAFAFADYIGLLHNGSIEQWDTPFNVYHQPKTRFVAHFVGKGTLLPGLAGPHNTIKTELGILKGCGHSCCQWQTNTPLEILLRPDDIVLDDHGLPVTVINKVFTGSTTLYTLQLPTGSLIDALFPSHRDYPLGGSLHIKTDLEHLVTFSPPSIPV